ncbi:MAG: hypothetical protein LBM69_04375 [Lachnospiraceae bacterium]|jgi:hypothetical protein|nr:hypothetical protein [Lachnospiraceae bacterium]
MKEKAFKTHRTILRKWSRIFTTEKPLKLFVRREAKDRLFRFVFERNKKALMEIYNALNHTNYTDASTLEIITLEGVLYMSMKNDLAYLLVHTMNMYEQQSSYSPNWPLRMLIYTTAEYQKIALQNKEDLYSYKQIRLPKPKCVVFYSGSKELSDETYMKLSDSFLPSNVESDLELTVRVININRGHNEEFLKKCKRLEEYSFFVGQVDQRVSRGMTLKTAIMEAIDFCIQNNVMDDILEEHKSEVLGMVLTEYNERKTMQMLQREYRNDGRAEGRAEGKAEGKMEARDQMNLLNSLLLRDNRIEDLKRSTTDFEFQNQLLQEYQISEFES